jgi:ribosomal-protein-alanine acetyltransferase
MELKIENASIHHLNRLYEIEMECFTREAFTKQQITQLLKDYNSIGLVAKVNNKIVGFIIGRIYAEEGFLIGHILTLDISPSHRQKGIGQKLLLEIEKMFKEKGIQECRLEVREDNIAAINLYKKLGYKKAGKLRHYYGDAHGLYLRKPLT